MKKNLDIDIKGIHVPGHQSDQECTHDQYARMNAMAHTLANQYLTYCIQYRDTEKAITEIPGNLWKLRLGDHFVVKDIEDTIRRHIFQDEMITHMVRR